MLKPSELPEPSQLLRVMKSLAALDSILSLEELYRFHLFDPHWSQFEQLGSVRDGQGDDVFVVFSDKGCLLKGFVHDNPVSFPAEEYYTGVPICFTGITGEQAILPNHVSYCFWFENGEGEWRSSICETQLDLELFHLIQTLDGKVSSYKQFADDYFETEIDSRTIRSILDHRELTIDMAKQLNPSAPASELRLAFAHLGVSLLE